MATMIKKIRRQDQWNENNGLISKTYKLQKSIAEDFAEACELAGVSQKAQLETMMLQFINAPTMEPVISREIYKKAQAKLKERPAPPRGYYYDESGNLKVNEKEAEQFRKDLENYIKKEDQEE